MYFIKAIKLVVLTAFFGAVNTAFAQSYFNSPNDTIVATVPLDDVSVLNITQVHSTLDTIYFRWHKVSVAMPATWEASICDNGNCYTNLKDSGMMTAIVPGDNGLMSLHINPHFEAGTGIIRYWLYATNTPAQVDTLTWIVTALPSNSVEPLATPMPVVTYANRQINCYNIGNAFTEAILYDLNGSILQREKIISDRLTFPTDKYSSELLFVRLNGRETFVWKIPNY